MRVEKYDFSGWATKNDLRCSDGRTIRKNAFIDNDGKTVPLVWQHQHNEPDNVLGHALLENRAEGVYAYCAFNNTERANHAKELVRHGDIKSLSIYANQLTQRGGDVLHGSIRELSLVLAGANPGAMIDFPVLEHADGTRMEIYDEAIIYNGEDGVNAEEISLEHADKEDEETMAKEETVKDIIETFNGEQKALLYFMLSQAKKKNPGALKHADTEGEEVNGPTIKEVFDSLNEKQKKVLYFLIGKVKESGELPEEVEEEVKHSDYDEGGYTMNVFENGAYEEAFISHADMEDIFANAKRSGSLKAAVEGYADVIQHSITDVDKLFPDYKALMEKPELLQRQDSWVNAVLNGVHKSPFSRVKSAYVNITADEARAKGYVKGNQKVEEVVAAFKRTTDPQTIYKLQKLDRDDILDITDFDVVAYIKAEMKIMLNEELARAILIGDGRSSGNDMISESHIRPIWKDDSVYTITKPVTIASNASNYDVAETIIEAALRARNNFKGKSTPVAFMAPDTLTTMLLAKDTTGRRIYNSVSDLAAAMRVSAIHEVPVFDDASYTKSNVTHNLVALIVSLGDYNLGADKGGNVTMFDDFDIDYNKMTYLIETRVSGALVNPFSAIAIETTGAASDED